VVGGSARPLGATTRCSGATARHGRCGNRGGRHSYRLVGADATARAEAGPGGSVQALVMWQLLIGPFELKFNYLNTNSTV
jgi:hypothetical protein